MEMALSSLLKEYNLQTPPQWEHALREILQHLTLLGLWRSKFFERAAFYGGTALRMLYGLPRFSEDLDFTLCQADPGFDFRPFIKGVRDELAAFGFTVAVEPIHKKGESPIDSAFVKADTVANLLVVDAPEHIRRGLHREQRIRIKFEVDTDPPAGARYEIRSVLVPVLFQVKTVSEPCLFAGKLHALLFRQWKSRVKGRDFFDFVWFCGRNTVYDLGYFRHVAARAGFIGHPDTVTHEDIRNLLVEKFSSADIGKVVEDVRPFVRDAEPLLLWSRNFFIELAGRIQAR